MLTTVYGAVVTYHIIKNTGTVITIGNVFYNFSSYVYNSVKYISVKSYEKISNKFKKD